MKCPQCNVSFSRKYISFSIYRTLCNLKPDTNILQPRPRKQIDNSHINFQRALIYGSLLDIMRPNSSGGEVKMLLVYQILCKHLCISILNLFYLWWQIQAYAEVGLTNNSIKYTHYAELLQNVYKKEANFEKMTNSPIIFCVFTNHNGVRTSTRSLA